MQTRLGTNMSPGGGGGGVGGRGAFWKPPHRVTTASFCDLPPTATLHPPPLRGGGGAEGEAFRAFLQHPSRQRERVDNDSNEKKVGEGGCGTPLIRQWFCCLLADPRGPNKGGGALLQPPPSDQGCMGTKVGGRGYPLPHFCFRIFFVGRGRGQGRAFIGEEQWVVRRKRVIEGKRRLSPYGDAVRLSVVPSLDITRQSSVGLDFSAYL